MARESGAPKPGGFRVTPPGGARTPDVGGVSYKGEGKWRAFHGHKSVDFVGDISSSGARVAQTRGVTNVRTDAKTTNVTYAWTLPTRPGSSTATVTNPSSATASFTPDLAGTYVFRVIITFVGSADSPNTIQQDFTYVSA